MTPYQCLECKKEHTFYYGRYRDGFTCSRACDEAHEAKLLKEFNEWLDKCKREGVI